MTELTLSLPTDLIRKLRGEAETRGLSVSEFVRIIVERGMNECLHRRESFQPEENAWRLRTHNVLAERHRLAQQAAEDFLASLLQQTAEPAMS